MDLEAVEMAFRASLHLAGATALTRSLQFPEPDAEQRSVRCTYGHQAPRTVQNIPDCLRREPITVLQSNSIVALRYCHLNGRFEDYWEARRADTPKHAAGPPSGPTHGDRANAAGRHTLPPLAAYRPPPGGEVHKSRSPLAQRQPVDSYLLRIRRSRHNLTGQLPKRGNRIVIRMLVRGQIPKRRIVVCLPLDRSRTGYARCVAIKQRLVNSSG
jgi:hypothetical protein